MLTSSNSVQQSECIHRREYVQKNIYFFHPPQSDGISEHFWEVQNSFKQQHPPPWGQRLFRLSFLNAMKKFHCKVNWQDHVSFWIQLCNFTLKTGTPIQDGDYILKLLRGVSCPEIQLGVGIYSELNISFIADNSMTSIHHYTCIGKCIQTM